MSKPLHLFKALGHRVPSDVPLETFHRIGQFYFLEAELLDSWEFDQWLQLFADDVHYWAPVRENRTMREQPREIYPEGSAAHFDENLETLGQRVRRILSQRAWAEAPPSRTRHIVSNLRAYRALDEDGGFDVESTFYVYRTSGEKNEDWIVGKRFDRLRQADTATGFRIARRVIVFDMATILIKNLSSFY